VLGDGFIGLATDRELIGAFEQAGGRGKPRYAELTVCWAHDEVEARRTALEWWPNAGLKGELPAELPLPRHFEQAAQLVREEDVVKKIICGPDPERYRAGIEMYLEAGYSHVWLHQVGPDQVGFLEFCEREILPKVA
jgi:G6PDH family F420-dependent oxidoreductase